MRKNRFIIGLIIYLLFILMIPFCQGLRLEKFTEVTWGEIENPENTLVYKIEFLRNFNSDKLKYNEYILGDIIEWMEFQILKFPEKTNSVSLELKLHSSKGYLIFDDSIDLKGDAWAGHSIDFTFNESGLWFLELGFYLNRTGYNETDIVNILEYNGEEDIIRNDTILIRIGNKTADNIMFKEGLMVYTQSEFAQIRAAEATEETAKYQKEMAMCYLYSLSFLAISAGAAVIGIYISKKHIETYSKEEKESRRALFKPKISAKIHFFGPTTANIRISNIGSGSAQNIDISGVTHPANEKFSWKTTFMNPGEFQDILLKHVSWNDFSKNYEKIDIKIIYFDIYNQREEEIISINTKEIQKVFNNTTIVWQEEILNKINEQLEGIQQQLKNLQQKTK